MAPNGCIRKIQDILDTHLRHSTIGHRDRVMTDLKEYFESELAYRRAKDSYT
jgi:hypothetical protein